ncbi:MAG: DUF3791 domain-containing protein [Candidatus Accumulibacter sp.]|nr:DUF3791 domain-containing protein [Accumulibacter sp.]
MSPVTRDLDEATLVSGVGPMNENELAFAVFCIESIAERLEMDGSEAYRRLTQDSAILDEYILANYETLHTQGKDYIVEDIIDCMRGKGLVC